MLSNLDNIIFPDRCEVIEVSPQRYIYPIFKNGSTTLREIPHRVLTDSELLKIDTVDVFVRDPYERFLSGVQTFLRFNPQFDKETALQFINRYLFLDRHYSPQFHWLVNLQRHTKVNMRLLPLEQLSEITDVVAHKHDRDTTLEKYFANNSELGFYLKIDKVLTEVLIGKTVSMNTIMRHLEIYHLPVYNEIVVRSKAICTALE